VAVAQVEGLLRLKDGREKSLLRRHPWIFAGAIEEVQGEPGLGATVDVVDARGRWLARAAYSPHSRIRARVWTWNQGQAVGPQFLHQRLQAALEGRRRFIDPRRVSAWREVNAESDGLPGFIVDRYGSILVLQCLTAGAERWRQAFVELLAEGEGVEGIYERSDAEVRSLEGLEPRRGPLWGQEPGEALQIEEYGLRFWVDVRRGQKTGFYLDQRENRRCFRHWVRPGDRVLNVFAYTGAFTVGALAAGAKSVVSVESSESAVELGQRNLELNGLDAGKNAWLMENAFQALRRLRDAGQGFSVIVLDPPKFAPTPAHVPKAARGYKDINLLAFKLLEPGGWMMTFSCSGGLSAELFQKIIADAAVDAGVRARVVHTVGQPSDHPIELAFPEGRYLKGLVVQRAPLGANQVG
jgi:23S rRNA (cytosine1962-C5)-methyltransferase